MNTNPGPPPFDVELSAVLASLGDEIISTVTPDMLLAMRESQLSLSVEEVIGDRPILHTQHTVPGPDGQPDIVLSVFRRSDHVDGGPGFYHIHGGGMIMGDRFYGIEVVLDWVESMDAVAITVEYRLAPEHPDPAPVEDCYAGLEWVNANAELLGFNARRLVIIGGSAGGGLAAGVALMARDKGGPTLAGQVLIYPMLDDRNDSISSRQVDGVGIWDRTSNDTAWDMLLGARRKGENVSIYASPSRATDLSGLPPAYIEVGSVEVFRDEDVAYASAIWASGGVAELHVWPGAFHGFDLTAPHAAVSVIARETRTKWVERILAP